MDYQYFATKTPKDCVLDCQERTDDFYNYLLASGQWQLFLNSYTAYHRPGINLGQALRYGDKGQYLDITVNIYRNLTEHAVSGVVSQRVEYTPRAANTDSVSQSQTILAKGLLEYYHRTNNLDQLVYKIVRDGYLFGESYLYLGWDSSMGEMVNVDLEGRPIFNGDIKGTVFNVVDVVRDVLAPVNKEQNWHILVERVNKYDLAEQYPHLAEKILNRDDQKRGLAMQFVYNPRLWATPTRSKDFVVKYTFLHKKCNSLPLGRVLEYLDEDCILFDAPLPYEQLPVHKFFMTEQEGVPFCYSPAWDLLNIQDNVDRLVSAVVTNNAAFAVQSIILPDGCQVSEDAVNKGLMFLKTKGPDKPEALQLTASAPETYQLINFLLQLGERLMPSSAMITNSADAFKTSGSALALLQSLSAQYNKQIEAHYVFFLERVGTAILYMLRYFGGEKRTALISGKANQKYLKDFSAKDLDKIQRVYVDLGNPVMRTLAGNYELATTLVNQGVISSVDNLVEVLSTGRIEPVYEAKQAQDTLIRAENENLAAGIPQPVLITDNHPLHISEHLVIFSNPEERKDPEKLAIGLAHIQAHILEYQSMPPILGMIHQIPPMSPVAVSSGGPPSAQTEPQAEPEMPNMPNMPEPAKPA